MLKHQKEKRSSGLDVSVKETSVCIVDDAGKIVREARVARVCFDDLPDATIKRVYERMAAGEFNRDIPF